MNLYRCTVTKRDGSGEPKVIYLLADNPGDAEILACMDAGLSGAELSLHSTSVEEAAIEVPACEHCGTKKVWYKCACCQDGLEPGGNGYDIPCVICDGDGGLWICPRQSEHTSTLFSEDEFL